jgi:hypothetical protein
MLCCDCLGQGGGAEQALEVGLCARNGPAPLTHFAPHQNLLKGVYGIHPMQVKHDLPIGRLRHQQHASNLETEVRTVCQGRVCENERSGPETSTYLQNLCECFRRQTLVDVLGLALALALLR